MSVQRVLLSVLGVALLIGWAGAGFAQSPSQADYALDNMGWNGLSTLTRAAAEEGITLMPRSELVLDELDVKRPLMLVYPMVGMDFAALEEFLADGGRILVADDFGVADQLLARFDIARVDAPADAAQPLLRNHPKLPVLKTPGRHALLRGEVRELVANHPTAFESSLPAVVYYRDQETGFAYDLTVGEGKLIAVADASLYINLMLEVADNRTFALNTLRYVCADASPCEVDVFVGAFSSRGRYGDEAVDQDTLGATAQREMVSFNETLQSLDELLPARRLLRALTLVVGLGLAMFCVSMFPMRAPRFLSIRFRPRTDRLPRSEFERRLEDHRRDGPNQGFVRPLAILRFEFERLFLREVFGEGQEPDSEERYRPHMIKKAARRYAARAPGEAKQRERQVVRLMKQFARVPVPSQIFIEGEAKWSERHLIQMYRESLDVLDALGVREEYERRARISG